MALIDDDIRARLKALYDEGRAYHNWAHIQALLGLLDLFRRLVSDEQAVAASIYFHDAIYDSRDKDNEERSASLALDWLETRTTAKRLSSIATSILATKTHTVPEGVTERTAADIRFLVDADLAIFGSEPEVFEAYDVAIRQEYAWVDEEAWRTGRAAVLKGFLDRPTIFAIPEFRDRFEQKARHNLRAAIAKLTA